MGGRTYQTRGKFLGATRLRREKAAENIRVRLCFSDDGIIIGAKRFRDNIDPSKLEVQNYRVYLQEQLEILETKIKSGRYVD